MNDKLKEGGPGSGDFGHAGRPGEPGGSAADDDTPVRSGPRGAKNKMAPGGRLDTQVAKRAPAPPHKLEPHEVDLLKRLDRGEVTTMTLQKDGTMKATNWPDDWEDDY